MRVLLATGDDRLNDQIAGALPREWEEARCFHRAVLTPIALELHADAVVLAEALDGTEAFAHLLEGLWLHGFRVVLLAGDRDVPATRALMREAVKYHVYDFVYNRVTGEKVVERILHPAVPVEIEKELLEPAGGLAEKVVPEAVRPPKRTLWDRVKRGKEAADDASRPGKETVRETGFSGDREALSGIIAVASPWMSKNDPAIAAVFCAEYLSGLGRKVALLDGTREKAVRRYAAEEPGAYGRSDAWLLSVSGGVGRALAGCDAVIVNVGEHPEDAPVDAAWKLLALGRPAFVGGFSAKRWGEVALPGFSLLADSEDGPEIAQVLRVPAVKVAGYDAAYQRIDKRKLGA